MGNEILSTECSIADIVKQWTAQMGEPYRQEDRLVYSSDPGEGPMCLRPQVIDGNGVIPAPGFIRNITLSSRGDVLQIFVSPVYDTYAQSDDHYHHNIDRGRTIRDGKVYGFQFGFGGETYGHPNGGDLKEFLKMNIPLQ